MQVTVEKIDFYIQSCRKVCNNGKSCPEYHGKFCKNVEQYRDTLDNVFVKEGLLFVAN